MHGFRKFRLITSLIFIALFGFSIHLFGAPPTTPYYSGETLNPDCSPGDTNCTVNVLHNYSAPVATANYGLLSVGNGAFDGSTSGYFVGSASGTYMAVNAASGYAGNLMDLQVAGSSKLVVTGSGKLGIGQTSPVGNVTIQGSPTATGSYGMVNIGHTDTTWDGVIGWDKSAYQGSGYGTMFAISAPNSYPSSGTPAWQGDIFRIQVPFQNVGYPGLVVDYSGKVTMSAGRMVNSTDSFPGILNLDGTIYANDNNALLSQLYIAGDPRTNSKTGVIKFGIFQTGPNSPDGFDTNYFKDGLFIGNSYSPITSYTKEKLFVYNNANQQSRVVFANTTVGDSSEMTQVLVSDGGSKFESSIFSSSRSGSVMGISRASSVALAAGSTINNFFFNLEKSSGTPTFYWGIGSAEKMRLDATGLSLRIAPTASANYGLVSLGSGAFDGVTSGYYIGSASGTFLGINASSTYTGNFVDYQVAGSSKFVVTSSGSVGIGSASPSSTVKLDVRGGGVNHSGSFSAGAAADYYSFDINPTISAGANNQRIAIVRIRNRGSNSDGAYTGVLRPLLISENTNGGEHYIQLFEEGLRIGKYSGGNSGIVSPSANLELKGHGATSTTFSMKVSDINDVSLFSIRNDGNIGLGTFSPVSRLHIPIAPTASANKGLVSLGDGAFDGSTAGYFTGSASGTVLAINTASGYTGKLVDFQIAGSSKLSLSTSQFIQKGAGNVSIATFTRTDTGEARLSVEGYLENSTPSLQLISNNYNGSTYTPLSSGGTIGRILARGATNSSGTYNDVSGAAILFTAAENWTSSAEGSSIVFRVTKTETEVTSDIVTISGGETALSVTGKSSDTTANSFIINNSGSARLFTVRNDGFVAIGSDTSPDYTLDVETDSSSSYVGSFFNDGDDDNRYGLLIQAGADSPSANKWIDFNDGDGTLQGSICYTGGQANVCAPSDERLKHDIVDTTLSLSALRNIKVRDFMYNSDNSNRIIHGFVAQELYEAYPDAVSIPRDPNDFWSVSYSQLTPLIVKSIQELDVRLLGIENMDIETDFVSNLKNWFASVENGIDQFFANKVRTNELCVGSVCVTEERFLQMVNGSGSVITTGSVVSEFETVTEDASTDISSSTVTPVESDDTPDLSSDSQDSSDTDVVTEESEPTSVTEPVEESLQDELSAPTETVPTSEN